MQSELSIETGTARILYAESNSPMRRLCTLTLSKKGYSVTSAESGVQAWEALQSKSYDLLITDNEMAGLNGLELAKQARNAGLKLPIILASGTASTETVGNSDAIGSAARLQKPFTLVQLMETVRQVLREGILDFSDTTESVTLKTVETVGEHRMVV